jgi:hypothetical protein
MDNELNEITLIELGVYLEPHYSRLSSLLDILDIVEVEYEGGLYDEIYASSKSLKAVLDLFDSGKNQDYWFIRNSAASIAHLSRSIAHMKEVIVNSVSPENSDLFERYVPSHREIVEINKSYISKLGDELEKDITSKLDLKKGSKINAEDFIIAIPQNKLPHDLKSMTLDLDERKVKFANLATVFIDAVQTYQDFFESNEKESKNYDFDVTHVRSIRESLLQVREIYDTTIKPSKLHNKDPNYSKFIAHLENACNCLDASVYLLHLHERYLQDPRKDRDGRNLADVINSDAIYDMASQLTFQDSYNLLKDSMVYAVGVDELNFDSIGPVITLMKSWGNKQNLVSVYHKPQKEDSWKKMNMADAETYDLFDKSGLDPSRYYNKIAVVLHGVLYNEYKSDSGIPVLKDVSELDNL